MDSTIRKPGRILAEDKTFKTDFQSTVLNQNEAFRLVLVPEKFPDSGLRLHFKKQRKGRNQAWEDCPKFRATQMQNGEEICLELDTEATHRLLSVLPDLQQAAGLELGRGLHRLVVLEAEEDAIVEALNSFSREQLATVVSNLTLDNVRLIAQLGFYKKRHDAVDWFRHNIDDDKLGEQAWQTFFDENKWIFGLALSERHLRIVTSQPYYGGREITGSGDQRGDFLAATEGATEFAVLVEIKKPQTQLMHTTKYRNGAYRPHAELTGAVSQVLCNQDRLVTSSQDRQFSRSVGVNVFRPQGILLIGNCSELDGDEDKIASFERFRQSIVGIQVLTFDELLARAQRMLQVEEEESYSGEPLSEWDEE